jgi:hypothetical protein
MTDDNREVVATDDIETAIRAGAAVFNAGHYHAAHDAWEAYWLELESGTDDERFLHGLIQFTAAAHHAANGNREGATGLSGSALEYLQGLGDVYRDVPLEPVRTYLRRLHDTTDVGALSVPALRVGARPVTAGDLERAALSVALSTVTSAADPTVDRALEALDRSGSADLESSVAAVVTAADTDAALDRLRRTLEHS